MCRRLCAPSHVTRHPLHPQLPSPTYALGLMSGHWFLPTLAWLALSILTTSPRKPGSHLTVWLSQKTPALFS